MNAILDQLANGIATGVVYALVAAGLSLLFKVLDTVNFAHGEFFVLGGVGVFVITVQLGLNPWLGLVVAVIGPALIAVVLHAVLRGVLARNPLNVLLATFAVSLMISNLVAYAYASVPQTVPAFINGTLRIGPVVVTYQRLIAAAVALVAVLLLVVWLRRSRMGRSLRAVADNRDAARIIGIDTTRVDRVVFALSAATAGLAGGLLAPVTQVSAYAGLPVLVTAFVVVVLGGVGSVLGALFGGILLGMVEGLTVAVAGVQWSPLVGYILLLVVLLFRGPIEQLLARRKALA